MQGNLTAGDVLALTRNNDGFAFGGVGGFVLLFIFLLAISGNGFGWGNSATALGQSDIQNSLYFQSQDNAIRGLAQGQCGITDAILNAKYDNLLSSKDITTQIANQTAVLTNAMNSNTNAILGQMQTNVIDELRDKLAVTRDELSNTRQTAQITQNILSNLSVTAPKPPCYYGCRCNVSL